MGLQRVNGIYKGLRGVIRGDRSYKGLQGATRVYRGLQ